jgi:hypothetical protein
MATTSNTNDAPTMDTISDEDLPTPSDTTTIVAPQGDKHTHTVIFLHGREDCGTWFAQDFFEPKSSDGRTLAEIFPSIRWVFPLPNVDFQQDTTTNSKTPHSSMLLRVKTLT